MPARSAIILTLFVAPLIALLVVFHDRALIFGDPGTNDFVEYYSAFKLYSANLDPYDPGALAPLQHELGWKDEAPLMMWNPPWLLTLMSPILSFDFSTAAKLWLLFNAAATLFTAFVWARVASEKSGAAVAALPLSLLFLPSAHATYLGQSAILSSLGLCLAMAAVKERRDFLAGAALVLLSIKPHVAYLVLVALAWYVVVERRWRVVLGFVVGFMALLALLQTQAPAALSFWLSSQEHNSASQIRVGDWQVATLVGFLRGQINLYSGIYPAWPIAVVPGTCAFALLLWLMRNRPSINWVTFFPPLICLSAFTAPYGWLFDNAALLPAYVGLVALAIERGASRLSLLTVILLVVGLQAVTGILGKTTLHLQHEFFWYPLAMFVVWVAGLKLMPAHSGGATSAGN